MLSPLFSNLFHFLGKVRFDFAPVNSPEQGRVSVIFGFFKIDQPFGSFNP
jgi:hypothetical protein